MADVTTSSNKNSQVINNYFFRFTKDWCLSTSGIFSFPYYDLYYDVHVLKEYID